MSSIRLCVPLVGAFLGLGLFGATWAAECKWYSEPHVRAALKELRDKKKADRLDMAWQRCRNATDGSAAHNPAVWCTLDFN